MQSFLCHALPVFGMDQRQEFFRAVLCFQRLIDRSLEDTGVLLGTGLQPIPLVSHS